MPEELLSFRRDVRFRWSGIGLVIPLEWRPVVSSIPRRSRMPSVAGLLEQHELNARRRVEGLREEPDRPL